MLLSRPIVFRSMAPGMVLVFLFFALTTAEAATYYISPTGSDSNSGTQALPFRQIRKGISVAAAGDTLLIADGSYFGFDIRNKSGTSASPITIRATGTNAHVVPTTDRPDNRDTIFITSSNFWILDGLRSFNANRAAVRLDDAHRITIRNGVFGNNGTWGIFTNNSDDSLFEYNECYGSVAQHGIYVSNSSMRPTVRGNRLHHNAQCGLHMNGDLSFGAPGLIIGALVESNVVWSNGAAGGAGINMDGPQDSIVRNNLIYGNSAGGITAYAIDAAEGPRNLQILHNTIDMPSNARWAVLIGQSAGLVTVRNNILLHANSARGGLLFVTSTDVSNTDGDYNILDRITPNDGGTVHTLAQWQGMGHEIHSFSASRASLYVDPAAGDYHLRSGSTAIDAGTPVAVPLDIDGNARPAGAGYDIGCDEAAGNPPPPVINTLNPSSATAGGAAFTLTVTGSGFVSGAVVKWNGASRTTMFDSATQVRATITAADIAAAGTASVRTANPGSADSNAINFTINSAVTYSVTASPTNVSAGANITVTFTAPAGSSATDWIGMFKVGAADNAYVAYKYTNGTTSGTMTFSAPNDSSDYEFRYFVNNGYTKMATSNRVTVGGAANYTLAASPTSVNPGAIVTVTWTAPAGSAASDWIGMYRVGAIDGAYIAWKYTGGSASGSMTFAAPSESGDYDFRYFINGGSIKKATSNKVTVGTAAAYSLSASPASVSVGANITVSWTAGSDRTATDWIGLFKVGTADTSYIWWQYTNATASGSFNVTAPAVVGEYEFRYFKQNGYLKLATSNTITVGSTSSFTVTASPSTVAIGATITVGWTAPAGRGPTDWIGIYKGGTADGYFLGYKYTGGSVTGSMTFTAPSSAGQYEFRYFIDNGFVKKATSNTVTVQ